MMTTTSGSSAKCSTGKMEVQCRRISTNRCR
jgi:hypothetical protein